MKVVSFKKAGIDNWQHQDKVQLVLKFDQSQAGNMH
jgi:hypothetical protein